MLVEMAEAITLRVCFVEYPEDREFERQCSRSGREGQNGRDQDLSVGANRILSEVLSAVGDLLTVDEARRCH